MIVFLLILQVFLNCLGRKCIEEMLEELNKNNINSNLSLDDFDLEFGIDLSGEYIDFDDRSRADPL